ncbi:MAG: hypothetical protein HY303_03590 [Candidatus Wallbacteria bacterium]|nr:hypothetical protein [Candidatus Wallbacteria bacterium]
MTSIQFLLSVLLALLLPAVSEAAAGVDFMPLSKVKTGMKGKGRTVFSGTRPEEYDFEVLGIWHRESPGRDLIMVRCVGATIERTGLIAGMSGSPMYVEGKLIGALSGGWAFSKEPVGVVTPIESMLAMLDGKSAPAEGAGGGGRSQLAPFATPVFSSGIHPKALERFRPQLSEWGLEPMAGSVVASGPSTPTVQEAAARLEPGGSLCVPLIEGDLSMCALGTLTCISGPNILAFGHPMMGFGPVELPMAAAVVHAVVPSYAVSIKIGNSTAPVGTLTFDGRSGVMGRLGPLPSTCELEVRVGHAGAPSLRHARVARQAGLTPELLAMAASSVVLNEVKSAGPMTVHSRIEVELPGGLKARFVSAAATTDSPGEALSDLMEPLALLLRNPFRSVTPLAARFDFEVDGEARLATLDSIRINKPRFRPGETAEVTVTVRTYGGGLVSKTAPVKLPKDLEAAVATIALLEGTRTPTSLYVRLGAGRDGASVGGRELPELPGSVVSVLAAQGVTGVSKLAADLEVEVPFGRVVTGQESLPIEVLGDAQR